MKDVAKIKQAEQIYDSLKRRKTAIDDLASVAGVERAGVGDWEEGGKKKAWGGG